METIRQTESNNQGFDYCDLQVRGKTKGIGSQCSILFPWDGGQVDAVQIWKSYQKSAASFWTHGLEKKREREEKG